ncbi:helix-turn-helix transcriptional regulator [Kocuria sp. CPCC 205300]|uniref:helix-turn-helix transcriptional regulator n=1 Tax=Kocuria sabuli TaxID=3071448 RepID=UPI0036D97AEA
MNRAQPVRLRLSTTDPELVNEHLSQTYAGAQIRASGDDPAFVYRQDVDGDTDLTLARFYLRGQGRVNLRLEDRVTVSLPGSGTHRWEINGHRGTGLAMKQPDQDYRAVLESLSLDTVDLRLATLVRTARTVYGNEALPVSFTAPDPVSARMAAYWKATHALVRQGLTDPAVADVPLLRADLFHRMTVATLETFPLAGDPQARRETVATRQAAYTRAVEFIHAALSLPITVEDVARHANLSTVELTRTFRAQAGTTAGAYLRRLRLAAAHQDLLRGDPTAGDTVAAVAVRWGFAYPGDFARRHRAAYGQNPAHTLRH